MGQMRILDREAGDVKVIWDKNNADEVDAAKEQFNKLTKKKNFIAYSVKKDGNKGKKIDEFDPNAEMIILSPMIAGG